MRYIICADIHGCAESLDGLLYDADYSSRNDQLIINGDMIDRGIDSYRVVKKIRKLVETAAVPPVIVRGNHEQMMIDVHASPSAVLGIRFKRDNMWQRYGGDKTLESIREARKKPEEIARFLKKNSVFFYETPDFIAVHADPKDLKSPHICMWETWSVREKDYNGKIAVVGHTPMEQPVYFPGNGDRAVALPYDEWMELPETGMICIDTGGVYGEKFTAMIIEDKKYKLIYTE